MISKKNTQILLCLSPKEQERMAGNFFPAVLALLTTSVAILAITELIGFPALYPPWVMLSVGCGVCILFGVATVLRKQNWFYPIMLLLLLGLSLCFGAYILQGVCLVWNQLGDTWTVKTGWVLPAWELTVDTGTKPYGFLFLSMLTGGMIAVLMCVLSACRIPVLSLLVSGALLVGMIAFQESVAFPYVLPVLLVSVLLLVGSGSLYGTGTWRATLWRLLPCVLGCAVLLSVASLPTVQHWASKYSGDLQDTLHHWRYETEHTTLPEGDFTDFSPSQDTEQLALIVNMEKAETMYLRGFTGTQFDGNAWTPLERSALADQKDLLYWLQLYAFHPNAQFAQSLFSENLPQNRVTVQNIGACSRYLYLPYHVCADDKLQAENLNTDGAWADGKRTYVFTTVGGVEQMAQALAYLQTSEEARVQEYRKAESVYRDFVYDNYLHIPQEVQSLLQEHWNQVAAPYGGVEQLSSAQVQECILAFLQACFPEEGEQSKIPLPLDMVQGSSYQYATVAVLTLRYFGIPARYAEGYIIPAELAMESDGSGIEVTGNHAAAWAEFYQSGIGWIPMAMMLGTEQTPQGVGENPTATGGQGTAAQEPEEGKEWEEPPQKQPEEIEPDGGDTVSLPAVMRWGIVAFLMVLLLLLILLFLRHRWVCGRKQKRFAEEDTREAIATVFADTERLLDNMGMRRGNGSMQNLVEPIRQAFGDDYAATFSDAVELNACALFSSREMTAGQRECVTTFHHATLQYLKSRKKWYERIWLQWILCLY